MAGAPGEGSVMAKQEWETEEVLAFVYDVRPWRDLDDAERAEWCRRVKHVRDTITTDGKAWTNERLAGLFGLALGSLRNRLRRSGGHEDAPRANDVKAKQRAASEFKRASVTDKVAIIKEALQDDLLLAAVQSDVERSPASRGKKSKPTVSQSWEKWLSHLNGLLMDGARLADQSEGQALSAHAEGARVFYDRITERKLDAELRAFFDEEMAR